MQQLQFFDAIEKKDIKSVKRAIAEGAEVNVPNRNGTALYRSVKQHNWKMIKLLVDQGADCNAVYLHFDFNQQDLSDVFPRVCSFYTPIDFLCKENQTENDHILQYLLQKRPMMNEHVIDQRIEYCKRLYNERNQEDLFDYVTSCFLRKNMYEHIWPLDVKAVNTLIAGVLNFDASLHNEALNAGGSHEVFLTIMIRSLFEQLVHYNLRKNSLIQSSNQYTNVLRELLHNLETYSFMKDLYQIPYSRRESFYPYVVENIITKLKNMKHKEEYTFPMAWSAKKNGHAICLNFVVESDNIIIRIDNLYKKDRSKLKHKILKENNKIVSIIPKIIGRIPVNELDDKKDYFKYLLICMKERHLTRNEAIEILYKNKTLEKLKRAQLLQMDNQLEEQAKALNCFIPQAKTNCFIKCHEPGLAIRSNDRETFETIKTIVQTYTVKLAKNSKDIEQRREKLEDKLLSFWQAESNIEFNAEYAAKLHPHVVVWLDEHIGVPGDNESMKQRFRRIAYPLHAFTNVEEATAFIQTQEQENTSVFLITSGTLGSQIVPNVFDNQCVVRIYIYCYKIPKHIGWAAAYVKKLKLFDFDAELLISLTHDIASHLETIAMDVKKKKEPEEAAGLLDWAAWLYHDALINEQAYYQVRLDNVGRKRKKLNENYNTNFPDQFNT